MMKKTALTGAIRKEKEYKELLAELTEQARKERYKPILLNGLCEGARLAFYISLCEDISCENKNIPLILVSDEKDAIRIVNGFSQVGMTALHYPQRDFVFFDVSASHDFEQTRLKVLAKILNRDCDAVIATPEAALQLTIPPETLRESVKRISISDRLERDELVELLEKNGYRRVDLVDAPGQYAVRGGILDLFPPESEYPIRMDFFDDEIEQMGYFNVLDQRKMEMIDSFFVLPARELTPDTEQRAKMRAAIVEAQKKAKTEDGKKTLAKELAALDGKQADLPFVDKYFALLYPQATCLLDYFDAKQPLILQEYKSLLAKIEGFDNYTQTQVKAMLDHGVIAGKYALYQRDRAYLEHALDRSLSVIVDAFAVSIPERTFAEVFSIQSRQTFGYGDQLELLCEELKNYHSLGYACKVLCENEFSAKATKELLAERGILSVIGDPDATVELVFGIDLPGFEIAHAKHVMLSLYQNAGSASRIMRPYRKTTRQKTPKNAGQRILSYAELTEGDYVVHINYGIGLYVGMQSLLVNGFRKDYLKIQYAGTDVLYVPCDRLDVISKYIGARGEGGTVKLSKMSTAEWDKIKSRTKAAAKSMAKELIALYAARLRKKGHAFSADDAMQREFESAFEFVETDGQLAAIADIKRDMEQEAPMDRLLCGDVGFGKTEVALRAAFKAVVDGKQVAILVPTTILAMQHYQTLLTRMRGFPVHVDMISRFSTAKQNAAAVRRLKRGETDIIVGTHRLLSKDIAFQNLGLVIVDEEQRFGVAQKEKLKQLLENVDVLTLTATPIPRTLNMAMSGIRDMSVLEEAPLDRVPVQSYVLEYDPQVIGEAIRRELRRGGQVFYLHNRVEDIHRAVEAVQTLAPDARVACAHGKMDKEELSDIWQSMVSGEIDVLVSTTIIETGVDIPNANTLIIDEADHLGLSQLHQIRGRIGRSGRRAYAYFTYPANRVLDEIATKRLCAIRDYTEFGAGFQIALRDLEIRGAGNLLGAEQHGHIATVGYDLYMRILNEAVLEEKGEILPEEETCSVQIGIRAHLPERYITNPAQRIAAYRKISLISSRADYSDVLDELLDRYGDPPLEVKNLLLISLLRALATKCGWAQIEDRGIIRLRAFDSEIWSQLAKNSRGRLLLSPGSEPYVTLHGVRGSATVEELLKLAEDFLQKKEECKE